MERGFVRCRAASVLLAGLLACLSPTCLIAAGGGDVFAYADFPSLSGPYLGQPPPGETAVVFAPGIVKPPSGFHGAVVFNEAGDEAWWTAGATGRTYATRLDAGVWTRPVPLPFDDEYGVREPAWGPGEEKVYFLSRRPPPGDPVERERLWWVERIEEGWSAARVIDPLIAAQPTHWSFSFTAAGDLYFTSEAPGVRGKQDIRVARRRGDGFAEPEDPGPAVNSGGREYCPFVAPDESYLLFARNVADGTRRADLFVSFRTDAGGWTPARNLGPPVNSEHNEVCPVVTADGRYLFFLRASSECNDVWWIDADVISQLRP